MVFAEESPDVSLAGNEKHSQNGIKSGLLPVNTFVDCLGDNCPFPVSITSTSDELENEVFEIDQNLLQLRDEIDSIRAKISPVRADSGRIRLTLPVRQIRNQLKMANRFGKRDKLRMSNRFG